MKKNRIAIFCVFCLFYLFLHSIGYSSDKNQDEWEKNDKIYRLGYILGVIRGVDIALLNILPGIFFDCTPEMLKIMTLLQQQGDDSKRAAMVGYTALSLQREFHLNFGRANMGQIHDEIQKIYSDPRTKNWSIDRVILMAKGRLGDGWTEKDLDEVIAREITGETIRKEIKSRASGRMTPSERDSLWKKPIILERAVKKNKEVLEILIRELLEIETDLKKD
jgi:hypothetical protein